MSQGGVAYCCALVFKRPKGTLEMNVALNELVTGIYQHNVPRGRKVLLERNADQEEWETFRGLLCNSAIVNKKKHCPYTPNTQY